MIKTIKKIGRYVKQTSVKACAVVAGLGASAVALAQDPVPPAYQAYMDERVTATTGLIDSVGQAGGEVQLTTIGYAFAWMLMGAAAYWIARYTGLAR